MAGLQKSMKSHRRSEHCILSSVAFMLAGVRSTLTLAQEIGGSYSQTNRNNGLVLSTLVHCVISTESQYLNMILHFLKGLN